MALTTDTGGPVVRSLIPARLDRTAVVRAHSYAQHHPGDTRPGHRPRAGSWC